MNLVYIHSGICVPGSACLYDARTATAKCVVLFNSTANLTCVSPSTPIEGTPLSTLDMGCRYNLTCQAAPVNVTGPYVCTAGVADEPKSCNASVPCPFGQACACVPGSKQTCNTYVFGDVCEPLLRVSIFVLVVLCYCFYCDALYRCISACAVSVWSRRARACPAASRPITHTTCASLCCAYAFKYAYVYFVLVVVFLRLYRCIGVRTYSVGAVSVWSGMRMRARRQA